MLSRACQVLLSSRVSQPVQTCCTRSFIMVCAVAGPKYTLVCEQTQENPAPFERRQGDEASYCNNTTFRSQIS